MRFHAPAIMYFNAVRKAGSIRGAARTLNVASSAVNRQILNLEQEIGGPLFERRPAGLKLTAVGEMFARHVIVVIQDLERFKSDVHGLSGGSVGTVRLANVESLNESVLPELIKSGRTRSQRVTVKTQTMGSFDIQSVLANGDVDIGVAFALRRHSELRQVTLARLRLGALVSSSNPLAKRRRVSIAKCMESPLIFPGSELATHQLLQPLLARLPVVSGPVVEANSIELMRELAERGVGISFHTRIGVERLLETGRITFVPLDNAGEPVWADLGVYVRADRALPMHVEAFVQDLVRVLHERESLENAAYA